MNPQLKQFATDSYNSSKALEDQFNQQATQRVGEYNTAQNNANNAQSDLSNFTKNMQSGTDIYGKQLQAANQNAGYDVNNLNQAQNQVSQLTGIMGGLPRALQASNANYGATAGNVANQYATTGANLNQSLQLANQNAQNQLAKQSAGLTGAQNATQAGVQTQDQQRQAYTATAANAVNVMQTAQAEMNAIQTLAQQQGNYTAQQQQTWANAQANYAAAQASLASAQQAVASAHYTELQTKLAQSSWDKNNSPPQTTTPPPQTSNSAMSPASQQAYNNTMNSFWGESLGQFGNDFKTGWNNLGGAFGFKL